jgi:hypothetical protein
MFKWLRKIDEIIFSPPHRFEAILAFVVLRLGCDFEDEAGEHLEQNALSEQTRPNAGHAS